MRSRPPFLPSESNEIAAGKAFPSAPVAHLHHRDRLLLALLAWLVIGILTPGLAADGDDPRILQIQNQISLWEDAETHLKWQNELELAQQKATVELFEGQGRKEIDGLVGGVADYYNLHYKILEEEVQVEIDKWTLLKHAFQFLARGRVQIGMPHIAFGDATSLDNGLKTANAALERLKAQDGSGDLAVGLTYFGGQSRNSLRQRIADEKKMRDQLQQEIADGNRAGPASSIIGTVTHNTVRTNLATHQQTLTDLKEQIAAGTAGAPGPYDPAALKAQLNDAQLQLDAARAQAKKGEFPGITTRAGVLNGTQLDAAIAAKTAEIAAYRKQVDDGTMPVVYSHFAIFTRQQIEAEIDRFEGERKAIKRAFDEGTYAAQSRLGMALDENTIKERLAAKPPQAEAELLSGSLTDIDRFFNLDSDLWDLRLMQFKKWKKKYMTLTRPLFLWLEHQLAILEQHRESIGLQLAITTRHWEREIAFLQACLDHKAE